MLKLGDRVKVMMNEELKRRGYEADRTYQIIDIKQCHSNCHYCPGFICTNNTNDNQQCFSYSGGMRIVKVDKFQEHLQRMLNV